MKIPRHIFKAYDVRGLAEEEITPTLAHAIGRAFTTLLQKENDHRPLTIAVGRDMRETSISYQDALVRGIIESGANVLDIGLVSTPAFYFGVGETRADGGVMISASHNPAEYNGFKMTRNNAIPVSGETGILEIADIIESESYAVSETCGEVKVIEGIPQKAVLMEMTFAGDASAGSPKIIADSANGMGAQYLDLMFEKLGFSIEKMFWELDGTFPNHEADPLKEENLAALCARVKETGFDLGIATDGDGDRIFFVDNTGSIVPQAIIRGILSQAMLKKFPGSTICYDIRPGKITKDMILESGGVPIQTRVGHSLIKEKMREVNAVYGGESSGHFFYKFENGTYEGPVTAAMQVLAAIFESQKSFAEFVAPFKKYIHSGEINFKVDDKIGAMERIKAHFNDGKLDEMDGISIEYPDFWFNVRPSNTEPILRFALEAVNQETMEKRRDEVKELIERT